MFDTLIKNAVIYDGSGRVPYANDVGITDGRIAAIGRLNGAEAKNTIEADRLRLCPGFVDVHSHADMTAFRADHAKTFEPLARQGITTYVGGNCGASMAPFYEKTREAQREFYQVFLGYDPTDDIHWQSFGELLDHMDTQGQLLNCGVLVGHGILRLNTMGFSTDAARPEDMRTMKTLLAESLEGGAVGMSTGLQYFPGLASDEVELTQLARIVHNYNGVFTSHLRSYNSDTLARAIAEVTDIGRKAEVPVQISHLFWVPNLPGPLNKILGKVTKGASWVYNKKEIPIPLDSAVKSHLQAVADLNDAGFPVGVDAMPTSAGFTHLFAFLPPWAMLGGTEKVRQRIADPKQRKEMLKSIENGVARWPHREKDTWSMNFFKTLGWGGVYIMSVVSDKNQQLIGRSIEDIANERKMHPFDVACDLLLEEEGRVLIFETATFPGDKFIELSLKGSLTDPNVSIVTDTILLGFGRPAHLFYDCYPKFLGQYARDKGYLTMAEAIRKCTALPASQLQLRNRGEVKEGYWADLVLFDEHTIASNSTADDPAHFPSGISHVFINGQAVVDPDGFHPDPLPGRVIRRGQG